MSAAAKARIATLLNTLRQPGAGREENLIGHGAGYCLQYLDFLAQGLGDYAVANGDYLTASDRFHAAISTHSGTLTPEQMYLFEKSTGAMRLVQYRIETFYVFGKILLDRIADMVLLTFDLPQPRFGSSHNWILAKLAAGWARGWRGAEELRARAEELKTTVVDFRTEELEHRAEFRSVRSISIGPDRQVRILTGGMLYPEPTDAIAPRVTESPYEVLANLERYVDTAASFIEANVERSILMRTDQAGAADKPAGRAGGQ